MGLSEELD